MEGGVQVAPERGERKTARPFLRFSVPVLLLAALLVFVVPFWLPVQRRLTISSSYVAGYNNTAAIAMTVLLSVGVLALSWRWNRFPGVLTERRFERTGRLFIAVTVTLTSVALGVAGLLVMRSHAPYLADAGYFIQAAIAKRESGLPLYTGLEFAYGPLLLLPEVWLSRGLHLSMQASYFMVLVAEQAVGLLLVAWVIDQLRMTRGLRRLALALLAFGCISPLLGLNYTFLRFGTPLAVLVAASRIRDGWRYAAFVCAGTALVLCISPEMGLALSAGLAVLALERLSLNRFWGLAALLPAMVAVVGLGSVGKPYLQMLAQFSRGTLNIPVGPWPHLMIFLFAVVWLVPWGLAPLLRRSDADRGILAACYAFGLATLPAALGRCDPLHVFFNGLAFLLLSCVVASRLSRRGRPAWGCCLAAFVGWQFYVNEHLQHERTVDVLRLALEHPRLEDFSDAEADPPSTTEQALYRLDVPALNALVGHAPVATPVEVGPRVIADLIASHHFAPDFYSFGVDCISPAAEARRIREMNRNEWALLPRAFDPTLLETTDDLGGVQGFVIPYPLRNANPTNVGEPFQQNIDDNWVTVRRFGPLVLMRRRVG